MSLTAAERTRLIQQYAAGPAQLRAALAEVPAAALQWRPGDGKWSAHEVVIHCADSETNSHGRIRYLLAEAQPLVIGYDQDRWAQVLDYHRRPLDLALATVDAVRANTVPVLESIAPEAWTRVGRHTESGPYSPEDWLTIYAAHLHQHAAQIRRNLAAWRGSAA